MPKLMAVFPRTEIVNEAQALTLCNAIAALKDVSFDTETTSEDPHEARPVVMSMSLPAVPWDDQWGDPSVFGPGFNLEQGSKFVFETGYDFVMPLIYMLEADGVDVTAHNYKYDAHICYRAWGITPGKRGRVFDPMIMDHILDENRAGRHGLKDQCEDYGILYGMQPFGRLFEKPPKGIDLSPSEWALRTNREQFMEYAATDPYATILLRDYLREQLKQQTWGNKTLWDYYMEFEEPFLRSVWEMEKNGVYVVPEALGQYRQPILNKMAQIEGHYAKLAGWVVNLNSTPDLRRLLFDQLGLPVTKQTKGGKSGVKQASVDKEVLEGLAETHPEVVEPLMEYRKIGKLLSTYVDGLSKHIRPDGRVHGNFNVHVVVTGRLSSSEPNLQNIEKHSEDERIIEYDVRRAFQAPEGRTMVVADFSQLEVVITAQISEDENLIRVINEGLDLHANTAALMFGIQYDDIIKAKKADEPNAEQRRMLELRVKAKALLFGILYGMQAFSLSRRLGVDEPTAEDYIRRFYQSYPGVLRAKEYWTEFCQTNGFVLTLLGRRRRLPEIWSRERSLRNRAERQLFNSIIQGTAADMMRYYMPAIAFDERLQMLDAKLVLQVHDEVVLDCPEPFANEVNRITTELMQASFPQVQWKVPLNVSAKIAKTWSEGK